MSSRSFFLFLVAFVGVVWPSRSHAQYDWSVHFGSQQTGFEKYWFGEWDLEVHTLRGIIDWQAYSTPKEIEKSVSKVTRKAIRIDKSNGSERTVHSSFTLVDKSGRSKSTVYLDPQTGKTVQRESFKYDTDGRLIEWRPVKDPDDVAFASTATTLYASYLPFGRVQFFSYHKSGKLKEWKACTSDKAVKERCSEAYIRFDSAGRIVEFVWLKTVFTLDRNAEGNLTHIKTLNTVTNEESDIEVHYDDLLLREKHTAGINEGMERIVAKGLNGTVVQYRVPSAAGSLQYTTTTWTYDSHGKVATILKGLDSYNIERNGQGRVVSVQQPVSPERLRRTYNRLEQLASQTPTITYNRYDLVERGTEQLSYTEDGLLDQVQVVDEKGETVARLEIAYTPRKVRRRPASRSAAAVGDR